MKILDKILLEEKIDEIAKYDIESNSVFGSSYFVYQNGNVVLKKHYGVTGNKSSEKVSDSTLFRLASMTKPITAVAMLILEEDGLVSLSDPASKYIPELKGLHIKSYETGEDMGEAKTEPTLLSLLSHSSGFGISATAQLNENDRKNADNTIKYFIEAGLKFEPFTGQEYSAYAAFDVLAKTVEAVTGEDFGEFLQHKIFKPCGMSDTTFCPDEEQWQRIIKMHDNADGKNIESYTDEGCIFEAFPCEHKLAGAGLISSLNDYAEFAKMLLHRGKTDNGRIMSEETAAKMSKPYLPADVMPGNQNWGLGVRVITDNSYEALPRGTFGWSGAYGSHFWIDPTNDICAVFMKNSRFDGGAGNKSAERFEQAVNASLK